MIQHINIVKYRQLPNKFCLGCRFVLKVMLIIKFVVMIFNTFGYSVYIFDIPQYMVTFVWDLILIVLSICSFSLVEKYKYVLLSIAGLLFSIAYWSNVAFYNENSNYIEYTSPINNTIIISKSSGYLFSGKTNFYIKHNFMLKNTGLTIELDEGYQQIRNAQTDILWEDDKATINYYDNDDKFILSKVIEF